MGTLLVALAIGLVALGYGVSRRGLAAEAESIANTNAELRALVESLESRLPDVRHAASDLELTFAQTWGKSLLGEEPLLIGVGPIEGDPRGDSGFTGHPLILDPIELSREIDRLGLDCRAQQRSLDELLQYYHDLEFRLRNTPSINPSRSRFNVRSFGMRSDPITREPAMHKGIDLSGRVGNPIYAPADGVVIATGWQGGYGVAVVIDHGYGLQTRYAHLSNYHIWPGARVRRGEHIADMGNTGKSTAPHLHYEVRRLGEPLDPVYFILDSPAQGHWPEGLLPRPPTSMR